METAGAGNYAPEYSKFDFPDFDETRDPLGWLNCREHFFYPLRTMKED